jgi:hypothetical protein
MGTATELALPDVEAMDVGELFEASFRCTAVYSRSWPFTDAHDSRPIVHCTHIADLQCADSTAAIAVEPDA